MLAKGWGKQEKVGPVKARTNRLQKLGPPKVWSQMPICAECASALTLNETFLVTAAPGSSPTYQKGYWNLPASLQAKTRKPGRPALVLITFVLYLQARSKRFFSSGFSPREFFRHSFAYLEICYCCHCVSGISLASTESLLSFGSTTTVTKQKKKNSSNPL